MSGGKPTERLRGRRGVEQRKRRMERSSWLCQRCEGSGRWTGKGLGKTTPAKVVNHIIPLALGGSDEDDNTENLCGPCDKAVTADQFGYRQHMTTGVDGWPA